MTNKTDIDIKGVLTLSTMECTARWPQIDISLLLALQPLLVAKLKLKLLVGGSCWNFAPRGAELCIALDEN